MCSSRASRQETQDASKQIAGMAPLYDQVAETASSRQRAMTRRWRCAGHGTQQVVDGHILLSRRFSRGSASRRPEMILCGPWIRFPGPSTPSRLLSVSGKWRALGKLENRARTLDGVCE